MRYSGEGECGICVQSNRGIQHSRNSAEEKRIVLVLVLLGGLGATRYKVIAKE